MPDTTERNPDTITADKYRGMFRVMSREELEEVAVQLALDCGRLRRELDEAQGVIR